MTSHLEPLITAMDDGEPALLRVVETVGVRLAVDRCWLYVRDPRQRRGLALARWRRGPAIPDVPEDIRRWASEEPDLPQRDPLFGRALAGEPLAAIEDVLCADVDPAIERALGHRAFIHLNLHVDGLLWGTLQPGMADAPRRWTPAERSALLSLRPRLAAVVAGLVRREGQALRSRGVTASSG